VIPAPARPPMMVVATMLRRMMWLVMQAIIDPKPLNSDEVKMNSE
jgi:hypothetical protein